MENLNLKQGIAGQVSCSSCLDGEGRLAMGPPDPSTTLRWHECGQGGEDSMVDDVCRNQPPSRLGWATVSSYELKSLCSPSISTMSNHQYKETPAVTAALPAATSTISTVDQFEASTGVGGM